MMFFHLPPFSTRRAYGDGVAKRTSPRLSGVTWATVVLATWGSLVLPCDAAPTGRPLRLVAFGDSLTAGYQLPDGDGFAPKLEAALRAQGKNVTVVNAGVSGDTTTGGLARLDWSLGDGADAVILELGANDMLRGIDPTITRDNLSKMIAALKARKIRVLLAGIRAVPSLGPDYAKAFDPIFADLAKRQDVALYPFFLAGMVGDPAQHLSDGMHPNAKGVDTIVARILPSVDALLKDVDPKS